MMYLLNHPVVLFAVATAVLLLAHEIGVRLRQRASDLDRKDREKQILETRNQIAVLLSLLLGFTMSMALGRFDERRQLVIDEANAIGTVYLRAGMQAEPVHSAAPALLREYAELRMAIFGATAGGAERDAAAKRSKAIQDTLWAQATVLAKQSPTPIVSLYAASLNDMIDLDGKRVAGRIERIPLDIWMLLSVLSVMTSLVIGYGENRRNWMTTFVPVLMVAIAVSLIADLDSPRSGFIKVSQQSMQSLISDMHMERP